MNTIMSIFKARTQSEREDFMRELSRSYGPILCSAIRLTCDEKDIFCKKFLQDVKERGE